VDNPLRIGILGLDTSHSVAFARILNNPDQPEDAAAPGGRITHAWADRAKGDMAATVEERREELTSKWGVAMVRRPTEMVGKVDAVMVLAVNGADHARLARPFLDEGMPIFVDKPFTNSVSQARSLIKAAQSSRSAMMSCSALRYADEVVSVIEEGPHIGIPFGGCLCGPGAHREGMPRPFFYGIHTAEMLQALFGTGIESVRCEHSDREDVATVYYKDGRTPVLRFVRGCDESFWFSVSATGGARLAKIEGSSFYARMLRRVLAMFQTKRPPVSLAETFEIIALLEAIDRSGAKRGAKIKLATL
jgi:predicted dehydrogenase